jgi:peptidyl-prolyl cis-trans isomerase C
VSCKAWILAVATALCLASAVHAAEGVVARVNGTDITEADIASAESEVGAEIASIPVEQRRRVLVEYLIETQLLAEAAEKEKLDQGQLMKDRLSYYRRRALRDIYFDKMVRDAVTEADAKKVYDEQVANIKPQPEVRARHILVETEEEASDIREQLARGEDFATLAKEKSKDPGSPDGDLGYFTKERMVKPFADAAFALNVGDLSEPVQTQFGWHIIKVEDKRERKPPAFEQVKDQIMAAMVQERMRDTLQGMRDKGSVEIVDADLKKAIEDAEKAAQPEQPAAPKQ